MPDSDILIAAPAADQPPRADRRAFFAAALGAAAVGSVALTTPRNATAQTALTDADVIAFLLQLAYLEAQFHAFATTGSGLATADTGGAGTAGTVTPGQRVDFGGDTFVSAVAREIAADTLAHVRFLRTALGSATIAQPAIDLGFAANSAFSAAMRAAGLVGEGAAFNPYASPQNYLLASFFLTDLSVTACRGATALLGNRTLLEAVVGALAVKSHHAATIRGTLYARETPASGLIAATEAISGARDALDGASDIDQGVRPETVAGATVANIAPVDGDGAVFGRQPGQVLNILYLNRAAVSSGGFFPSGVNGSIKTSAAS